MTNKKHLPKSIPSKDHEFSIEIVGNITKETYSGNFKCKIPNLRTQAQIKKTKAFLNGGFDLALDKHIINLHHMASYIRHTVTEAPDWYYESDHGYDLYDENVLEEIYHEVLKFEEDWLNKLWGDSSENKDEKPKE